MTTRYEDTFAQAHSKPEGGKASQLGWLLDSSIRLPGGFRIGLDGLIGLVPGVGDVLGGVLSVWVFYQASKLGAPKSIQLRMIFNILIDTLLGTIPVVGDLFDFMWKANNRNLALLERYQREPTQTRHRATLRNTLFLITAILCIGFAIWAATLFFTLLWQRLTAY